MQEVRGSSPRATTLPSTIQQWAAQDVEPGEIAARINCVRLRTFQERAWSKETVQKKIRDARIKDPASAQPACCRYIM